MKKKPMAKAKVRRPAAKTTSIEVPNALQAAFLTAYSKSGVIAHAALEAGIHRDSHFHWMKTDPSYPERFEAARAAAVETYEAEVYRRGVEGWEEPVFYQGVLATRPVVNQETGEVTLVPCGVRKFDPALLMFRLKKLDPSYRDSFKADVTATVTHDPRNPFGREFTMQELMALLAAARGGA